MARTSYIHCDDGEIYFVLDQHAELNFYSVSSLKQQFAGRHVAPLGHIILVSSHQSLLLLLGVACLTEKQHIFIVFGLIQPGFEQLFLRTR